MRSTFASLAAAFLAAAWPLASAAQTDYPAHTVTMVVPFPPGGVADLTARPVGSAMEKVLKQPVAVVNKQGAAGAVGMQSVAVSKPDGYTLLMALSSISIIPEADKLFGRPPAFTVDQFVPVALISADPTVLGDGMVAFALCLPLWRRRPDLLWAVVMLQYWIDRWA